MGHYLTVQDKFLDDNTHSTTSVITNQGIISRPQLIDMYNHGVNNSRARASCFSLCRPSTRKKSSMMLKNHGG